ncbi:Galactoside 2-alpha-L-fucosyltransferase [Linum grandiflorum]
MRIRIVKTVAASASLLLIISTLVITNIHFSYYLRFRLPAYRPVRVYNPSCYSRQQGHRSRSRTLESSPYFRSKLRQYENLHSRCGPLFNPTLPTQQSDCKYIVYTPPSEGLGNRMISLASTFLYALLTNRVLLVDFDPSMEHLFCEPFPNSTWFLPAESFPLRSYQFYTSHFRKLYSYGNLLKKEMSKSSNSPSFVQIYLHHTYDDYDQLFFKDEKQKFLNGVPWLVLISNQYFVPCIFQMRMFRAQLERWFPGVGIESVFHNLGSYLFNPSDQAWELISTFYKSHLAKAEERIGFQVRVFAPEDNPPSSVMKRILSCTQKEKILTRSSSSSKAILVSSLSSKYYKMMKSYFEGSGGGIEIYHASDEVKQKSDKESHNMTAWVDIYLLSMSHVLVTTSMSTFGYVAAGLGGIRPWMLMISPPPDWNVHNDNQTIDGCPRAVNTEPCFHKPPWFAIHDHHTVGRCEDVPGAGLKLVGGYYNSSNLLRN